MEWTGLGGQPAEPVGRTGGENTGENTGVGDDSDEDLGWMSGAGDFH